MNRSATVAALFPTGVTTKTFRSPADSAGEVAVICVLELNVKLVAGVPAKYTEVAPLKLVPVMTTEVPPAVGPAFGLTEVTVAGPM